MKLHELKQKRSTIAGQMRKLNDDYSEKRWMSPPPSSGATWSRSWTNWTPRSPANSGRSTWTLTTSRSIPSAVLALTSIPVSPKPDEGAGNRVARGGYPADLSEERALFKEMRAQATNVDSKGGAYRPHREFLQPRCGNHESLRR